MPWCCLDEKAQIQALDRAQPGRPLRPGEAGVMTHNYLRNGTTTLFAALDVWRCGSRAVWHLAALVCAEPSDEATLWTGRWWQRPSARAQLELGCEIGVRALEDADSGAVRGRAEPGSLRSETPILAAHTARAFRQESVRAALLAPPTPSSSQPNRLATWPATAALTRTGSQAGTEVQLPWLLVQMTWGTVFTRKLGGEFQFLPVLSPLQFRTTTCCTLKTFTVSPALNVTASKST